MSRFCVFRNLLLLIVIVCTTIANTGVFVLGQDTTSATATSATEVSTTTLSYKPCSICYLKSEGKIVPANVLNPDTPVLADSYPFVQNDTSCGEVELRAQAGELNASVCVALLLSSLPKNCGCPVEFSAEVPVNNTEAPVNNTEAPVNNTEAPAAPKPEPVSTESTISGGAIIGIVIGGLIGAVILLCLLTNMAKDSPAPGHTAEERYSNEKGDTTDCDIETASEATMTPKTKE